MDVYQIFPSYLCVKKFELDNQIQILQNIKNIHEEFVKSDTLNVETVYSQNASASLVDEEDFAEVKNKLELFLCDIFENFFNFVDVNPYISDMWTTCIKPKEQGQSHYHSNSLMSGVWYPFDTDYSEIVFYNPNNDKNSLNLAANTREFNSLNSTSFTYNPKKNDLILFPSYLTHQVQQNLSSSVRYSLAFNVFVKGNLHAHTSRLSLMR